MTVDEVLELALEPALEACGVAGKLVQIAVQKRVRAGPAMANPAPRA